MPLRALTIVCLRSANPVMLSGSVLCEGLLQRVDKLEQEMESRMTKIERMVESGFAKTHEILSKLSDS